MLRILFLSFEGFCFMLLAKVSFYSAYLATSECGWCNAWDFYSYIGNVGTKPRSIFSRNIVLKSLLFGYWLILQVLINHSVRKEKVSPQLKRQSGVNSGYAVWSDFNYWFSGRNHWPQNSLTRQLDLSLSIHIFTISLSELFTALMCTPLGWPGGGSNAVWGSTESAVSWCAIPVLPQSRGREGIMQAPGSVEKKGNQVKYCQNKQMYQWRTFEWQPDFGE